VVAPADAGLTAKTLLRRLFADAAAMLFWNPYGFGSLIALGLAGALFLVRARRPGGGFYGGLLILSLLVFNFTTTSWGGYVPLSLDPRIWYLAALPAAILFGLSFGTLLNATGGEELLGPWAAALSLAFLAAALWVNANVPRALIAAAAGGVAVVLTLLFAGLARRRPGAAKTWARAAAAVAAALALVPALILFAP
jgi:hypothetical protein